jgi:hypothetical protein
MDMRDDDLFDLPKYNLNDYHSLVCLCAYFNHLCEANVGFKIGSSNMLLALRDISVDEELTIDYQFIFTESCFLNVNACKCGAKHCRGSLRYDQYLFKASYIQRRIDELQTKWFSTRCYIKNYSKELSEND